MKYLEALVVTLVTVFAPIQAAIITTFALIIIDLITGILSARKQGVPITSSGLKRTVGKVLLYEAAIIIGFLVQQYLTGELLPATKLVTALIGLTELKSILENLDGIAGNSMFQTILSRILQSETDLEKKP